jgi:hypothetical protein
MRLEDEEICDPVEETLDVPLRIARLRPRGRIGEHGWLSKFAERLVAERNCCSCYASYASGPSKKAHMKQLAQGPVEQLIAR